MRFARCAAAMALIAGTVVPTTMSEAAHATPPPPKPQPSRFDRHDRQLLAKAVADRARTVSVLIGSASGDNAQVVRAVQALGGVIRSRNDSVGYVRAIVPTKNAVKASALAGVQTADLDNQVPLGNPAPPKATAATVVPPGPSTPANNPYLPTGEIGAPQFVAAHPTYDGRGVVMGVLDTGVDLLAPELQKAETINGTPTRKIIDSVTFTDPLTDNDPSWVDMASQVTASGGTFTVGGITYAAPADGTYRFGVFDERDPRLAGEYANDVNRDGNPPGSSGLFAVLWQTSSNTVWVDANQNHSFTDQPGMTDYKVHYDVGTFGTDNPATPVRETVPFVVQTDPADNYVNIGIVSGFHGTHVAGVATGNGFFGGAFNGAAPEAQVVSVRVCTFVVPGCTEHGEIEGMIYAEQVAKVDVVNMSVGGLSPLNDGNDTVSLIYDRLIEQSQAQMFLAAGNDGPALNTISDPGVASKVIAVGAYVTRATQYDDYGLPLSKTEQLTAFSSRGPAENGGLKPDIVAPGVGLSTVPAWEPPNQVPCWAYQCPPGYAVEQGTSMASPEAAGGAALLISAAKQTGVSWSPAQLREAIDSSARFIAGYRAHEQGNGLVQVGAAWNLLKQNLKTVDIASSAPVNTALSSALATPGRGPGIYQREGWGVGTARTLSVTFTRTSGPTAPVLYLTSWIGNDGTFTAPPTVWLGRTTVTVPIQVHPFSAGAHSAILVLNDPTTAGREFEMLNTVVAASPLDAAHQYTASVTGTIGRGDGAETFVKVPPGASAVQARLHVTSGEAHLVQLDPTGFPYPDQIDASSPYCVAPCDVTISAQNPQPGVWNYNVESGLLGPSAQIKYTVTTSLIGLEITPSSWTIDPAHVGTTYNQTFTIHNKYGPFTGNASGTSLGDGLVTRPTVVASNGPQVTTIDVASGTTRIAVSIGNPSDPGADLDLYLYDCTTGPCELAAVSGGPTADESVEVFRPAAGVWAVLVDPFNVPSGSTAYDYSQTVFNPANGVVTVSDPVVTHPAGSTWTVHASVTPNVAPPPGHFLQAFMRVLAADGSQLALAEVDLKNVQ